MLGPWVVLQEGSLNIDWVAEINYKYVILTLNILIVKLIYEINTRAMDSTYFGIKEYDSRS